MSSIRELKKCFHETHGAFNAHFERDLAEFFDVRSIKGLAIGFDVIKFDEEVVKPDPGVSTRDTLFKFWGVDAVKLIERLLDAGVWNGE